MLQKNDNKNGLGFYLFLIFGLVIIVFSLLFSLGALSTWGLKRENASLEVCEQILETQDSYFFKGDKRKSVRTNTAISSGKTYYGLVKSIRLFNFTYTYLLGNKNEVYFKINYDKKNWKPPVKDMITATTYAIFDSNDNVVGHIQQAVFENDYLKRDYYYLFYDQDDKMLPYLYHLNDKSLYDLEGNIVATVSVFYYWNKGIKITKSLNTVPFRMICYVHAIIKYTLSTGHYY